MCVCVCVCVCVCMRMCEREREREREREKKREKGRKRERKGEKGREREKTIECFICMYVWTRVTDIDYTILHVALLTVWDVRYLRFPRRHYAGGRGCLEHSTELRILERHIK